MPDTVPTPPPDSVDTRIVRMGVLALKAFSDDLTRDDAGILLTLWGHYPTLSAAEVAAILGSFPEVAPGPEPMPGGGWISGPSTGGAHQ